jgi:Fic family protein
MREALDDWERFIHEDVQMPDLVKCALLHYQFETIHPFLDGNGRVGRLMIVFYLVWRGRLPDPLLYVSSFFEAHRSDYYDRLQAVREQGLVQEWIRFFLAAVTEQASDAVTRAEQLVDLREQYRQLLAGTRSRAPEIVDFLFENPVTTASAVSRRLEITPQGAKNLISSLEREGVLTETSPAKYGRKRWIARDILRVVVRDASRQGRA